MTYGPVRNLSPVRRERLSAPRPKGHTSMLTAAAAAGLAAAVWLGRRRTRASFRGATVLITGGASGLGLALARRFGAEGALIYLVSRSGAELERAGAELRASGVAVATMVCDVRDQAAVSRAVDRIVAETGGIDVAINNAGILKVSPIEHTLVEDFADSVMTHFWGPFHVVRAVLPSMQRQGHGRIVNITSIGGRVAVPHLLPYCVGKFALVGFSDGLRAELRKDGIMVTTVVPGLMRTGSHVRVQVRGQHRREAQWFGLAATTPLTSMSVDRAARRIVEATRAGRARVTLGWAARAAEIAQAVVPGCTAMLSSAAAAMLPGPSETREANETRLLVDVDAGWVTPVLPIAAAVRHHEMPMRP